MFAIRLVKTAMVGGVLQAETDRLFMERRKS
jgi:hypothetical protein